jgi:hypothetical protein
MRPPRRGGTKGVMRRADPARWAPAWPPPGARSAGQVRADRFIDSSQRRGDLDGDRGEGVVGVVPGGEKLLLSGQDPGGEHEQDDSEPIHARPLEGGGDEEGVPRPASGEIHVTPAPRSQRTLVSLANVERDDGADRKRGWRLEGWTATPQNRPLPGALRQSPSGPAGRSEGRSRVRGHRRRS